MYKLTYKNKIVLVGKAYEIVELLDELCIKYELNTPIIQIIEDDLIN